MRTHANQGIDASIARRLNGLLREQLAQEFHAELLEFGCAGMWQGGIVPQVREVLVEASLKIGQLPAELDEAFLTLWQLEDLLQARGKAGPKKDPGQLEQVRAAAGEFP